MNNPLQALTEKIKKIVVLKAIKHALEKQQELENEKFSFFKKSMFFIAGIFSVILGINNFLPEGNFLFYSNFLLWIVGFGGALAIIIIYGDYFRHANNDYKYLKNINADSDEDILDHFDNVNIIITHHFKTNFFNWQNFDKSLSQDDIATILSTKLTTEQRDYLKLIIHEGKPLTYNNLVKLEKLFMSSKEILELHKNNSLTNFLKENSFTHLDTSELFKTEKIELKEIELEAEYKRIL